MQLFVLGCKPNTLRQTSYYHPLEIQYVSDENVVVKC